ncbi:MAG: amidohydrolase family protein [Phycisphaerales bacterium]|nr:amidohydrolase family protein [Phycisphaerales bacterium]
MCKLFSTSCRIVLGMLLCGLALPAAGSDEIPGAPQTVPIAIVDADIFPVSSPPIPGGTIVFDKGRITGVGRQVPIPAGARRIDGRGKRVYPGLFDSISDLGLVEINLVRQTVDLRETGSINPNVRAERAINPDSEHISVTRSNGVLLSLVAPEGGLISGSSAIIQLDGWTWEDLTLRAPAAIHLNWPNMRPQQRRYWMTESPGAQNRARDEQLELIRKTFRDARAYQAARQQDESVPFDSRWDAMVPVLEGRIPLVVHANDLLQIQSAVAFARREKLRIVIAGGYDAVECAELLRESGIPVILTGVHRLPQRRGEPYDAAYTLPRRLHEAQVKFAIAGLDRFNGNYRNLPYNAATAVAFGLDPAEALAAITLRPAEIFGVADRVGSLEVGKDATLFIADGDILEIPTRVEMAFVQGRELDLNDKQKRLYAKYAEKYRRQDRAESR